MDSAEKKRSPLFINSFVLKILALLTMTIDHLFVCFGEFSSQFPNDLYMIGRGIGRLAFPLFCFMIVQGAIHTRRFSNYALRLGICASAVSIGMIGIEYLPMFQGISMRQEGVIFVDLLLGATAVFCLRNKKWYIKLLSLLILGFSVASTFASGLECAVCGREIWFVPFFMRTQYGFCGVLMMILMYFGYRISRYVLDRYQGAFDGTTTERIFLNLGYIAGIVIAVIVYYLFQINAGAFDLYFNNYIELQLISIASIIFVFFYNGKPGYNKIWFRHGCYLYYMVHLIILYGVFMLIYG